MNVSELTAATVEPVTVTEVKTHCVIEVTTWDSTILPAFISAARLALEKRLHRIIARAKWRIYLDAFPEELLLPIRESQSIDQIQYIDTTGATKTVTSSIYTLDVPAQIVRRDYNQTWPTDGPRAQPNCVWVDVWAGYYSGPTGSPQAYSAAAPASLKVAVLMLVQHLWEHRGEQTEIETYENLAFCMLIDPYWFGDL